MGKLQTFLKGLRTGFTDPLFRNNGIWNRNFVSFSIGSVLAILLASSVMSPRTVTIVFATGVIVLFSIMFLVRPFDEKHFDRFRWGVLSLALLGYGFGALLYLYRSWVKWVWNHIRDINSFDKLFLASFFLLGVILGFFVVRNWSKDQKDFITSLTAVFGGAFIATVLGKLTEQNDTNRVFAFYAIGFTISGTLNLIACALFTANYTNKHSVTSRAIMDFLYGSDKGQAIDEYFQRNFDKDKNYAKVLLTNTLKQYREKVLIEFASKMDAKVQDSQSSRASAESNLDDIENRLEALKIRARSL